MKKLAKGIAVAAEEGAMSNAIRELRRLEPWLLYPVARGQIALPAERDKLRAFYGAQK